MAMAAIQRMGILVYDDVTMIDVAGPADVFSHANAFGARYETVLISPDGGSVRASNGLTLTAGLAAADAGALDTIIIPGAYGMVTRPFDDSVMSAVTDLTAHVRRIASVCTGSFLLAQAGLLDFRRATTHWTQVELFRRAFPRVRVLPDSLFVRDGDIITSAGVSSGIDLALAIVEDDAGAEIARKVARQMVIFLQRPGTQSQFSAPSREHIPSDSPLRRLTDAVAADPAGRYSLADMASIARVSVRTLTRLFHDEIGTTPSRYVELIRIEAAQTLLQEGATVAVAAERSGFGSAETLRRVFVSRVGSSPSVYLERVRSGDAAGSVGSPA
ncbi:GlxA family transcriptional regulator [Pseudolysinimonas sp.]|uniref:GlxA family transcriptional regulator n=1 Tax=Pseudolysinimonas sp. TaxID=2680009 RepID=UPI003F7D46C4